MAVGLRESSTLLVMRGLTIPDGIALPLGVSAAELRAYVAELIERLLALAAPH